MTSDQTPTSPGSDRYCGYGCGHAENLHNCMGLGEDGELCSCRGFNDGLVDAARLIEALNAAWDQQCCGNRNEDACESCRAYAEALRLVRWERDHA